MCDASAREAEPGCPAGGGDGWADSGLGGARAHRPRAHPASVPQGHLGKPTGPCFSKTLPTAAPDTRLPAAGAASHCSSLDSPEAGPPHSSYTHAHTCTRTRLSPPCVLQGFCTSAPTLLSLSLSHSAPNSPTLRSPYSPIYLSHLTPHSSPIVLIFLLPAHPAGLSPYPSLGAAAAAAAPAPCPHRPSPSAGATPQEPWSAFSLGASELWGFPTPPSGDTVWVGAPSLFCGAQDQGGQGLGSRPEAAVLHSALPEAQSLYFQSKPLPHPHPLFSSPRTQQTLRQWGVGGRGGGGQ